MPGSHLEGGMEEWWKADCGRKLDAERIGRGVERGFRVRYGKGEEEWDGWMSMKMNENLKLTWGR